MIVRIRTRWPGQPSSAPLAKPNFAALQPCRSRGALSFLYSFGLHVMLVWVFGSTIQAVNTRKALIHSEYRLRALEMPVASILPPAHLTDPVNSATPGEPQPEIGSGRSPAASAEPGEFKPPSVRAGGGSTAAPPDPDPGKRFVFPLEVTRKPAKQVLVQTESPPDLKLKSNMAVPEVLLWQLADQPKPKSEIVVAAHRREEPVRERETAPVNPQLTTRNREQELSELRHAATPPVPAPTVVLPVANTTPIRLLEGIKGNRPPISSGPTVTEPEEVHVISVPQIPVPPARVIVLPQGNQAMPPPVPPGVNTASAHGASSQGRQPGDGDDRQLRGTAAGVDAPARSTDTSGQPASAGAGLGIGKSASREGRVGEAGSSLHPTGGPGEAVATGIAVPPPGTTRIIRPKDGKYNVVVVGSSSLDAYPESAGILSGKLVYTVYVRTGGRKEWILQYCLPKAAEQAIKVRGSAVPIEAPYPFLIYRPKLTLVNDPDYLIVHGFITMAGRLEHLSTIGEIDPASKELLIGALEQWEFRPASRDGEPTTVEIALIIPREPI